MGGNHDPESPPASPAERPPESPAGSPAARSAEPPAGRPAIRLLVADDSADLASALDRLLGAVEGFESAGHVGDADEMLAAARERPPTVLLCDLTMPGTDPLEAIAAIKREQPGLRVVVFSGYDDRASRGRAAAAGADAFLSKGVGFDELVDAIRAVAARA